MDKELSPADVTVDEVGVRLHVMKGFWITLSPVRARALAHKILTQWPARQPSYSNIEREDFITCEFCDCHTNARVRACCELGRAVDLNRVTPEQLARWEEEADQWMLRHQRDVPEEVSPMLAMLAGRILVLLDELVRGRRKLEVLESEVGGDNGLRAKNDAGWAIANARGQVLRQVTLSLPALTRQWLEDLSAVVGSNNPKAAQAMIADALKTRDPAWRCGSCRDTGKWDTGIDCPACTSVKGMMPVMGTEES